tara:strand:- start:9312 stop:10739 length:1428 start_codon:yes stop_codon:yes gene_type:complete
MSQFNFSSLSMAALFSRAFKMSFVSDIPALALAKALTRSFRASVLLAVVSSGSVLAFERQETQQQVGHTHEASNQVKKSSQASLQNRANEQHKDNERQHKADIASTVDKNLSKEQAHQHGNKTQTSAGLDENIHGEAISLSPEKMAIAGIEVAAISPKVFANNVYAPGEIKANGYKSYIVSPRTESVVISRHATLGQHVEKGDALVTLFSESVAEAQATYRVAYNDWQRNKKLGKETVSESRLLTTETDYISAYSRLKAFGLTEAAIAQVVTYNSANTDLAELGEYTLIAQREGAVLSDDFSQGQRVSAGDAIMVLADESELWVEARVSPNKQLNLPKGTQAVIDMSEQFFVATVIQEAHTIDPKTRTRIVRLAVKNDHDRLHPGMFVKVNFRFETDQEVMAVPESALLRSSDGDWTVFVERHSGEFTAVEVKLGRALGNYREIIGLAAETRIVTKGAFFVASEIAKGGFDPHNH